MRIIKPAVLFCFFASNLFAQWIHQTVPQNVTVINSVNFTNTNSGIATGWDFTSSSGTSGRALTTINAGTTWNPASVPNFCRVIVSSEYVTSSILYGAGAINLPVDNSRIKPTRSDFETTGQLKSSFLEKTNSGGDEYRGGFFKSTDGGLNWVEFGTLPAGCLYLTYMDFLNANTGVVIGDFTEKFTTKANILKTTNGGLSWAPLLSAHIFGQFESVNYIDNVIIAPGYEFIDSLPASIIMKSTDSGANWERRVGSAGNFYSKVKFINNVTGFIAGGNDFTSKVFKTDNQGNTWNTVFTNDSITIFGINFFEQTGVGIIFGNLDSKSSPYTPYAFRTSNFGETWSTQLISNTNDPILISSCMLDRYKYYISGSYFAIAAGAIFHTANGGSVGVGENPGGVPQKFSLEQNYPNPFNPGTSIRYFLPKKSSIMLKIYDIKGKEIQTLVNEVKSEGSYEVKFDAGKLSSGVYYYKITAGDFSETKKMILVK